MRIDDVGDPRVADYRALKDAALRDRAGLFVAEGEIAVEALLASPRFRAASVLASPGPMAALGPALERSRSAPDLYVADEPLMSEVAGFRFHRGCVALGRRLPDPTPEDLLGGRRVVVLEDLTHPDNLGGVFRSALAFGVDAILLSPGCCDPLYRKAIRQSAGAVLHLPFSRLAPWPDALSRVRGAGFRVLALTPRGACDLADVAGDGRIALLIGTEGPGLRPATLALADATVGIAMVPGVDSLNVATAAGIALHHLRAGR